MQKEYAFPDARDIHISAPDREMKVWDGFCLFNLLLE